MNNFILSTTLKYKKLVNVYIIHYEFFNFGSEDVIRTHDPSGMNRML